MEMTGAIWKQAAHTTYPLLFHHVMPTVFPTLGTKTHDETAQPKADNYPTSYF